MKAIMSSVALLSATLLLAAVAIIPHTISAHAELIAQNITTYTLVSEPTTIQLAGSGNYNDWHYVIQTQATHGTVLSYDGVTGQALYQPNAGYVGTDSFTYNLVKNLNTGWFSMPATVKIAIVPNWTEYYPAKTTPVLMSQYVAAKSMSPANTPEIPGITNIEPYKATAEGYARYWNVRGAWELSGQSWWSLTLGQKQWLMENLPFQTGLWAGVYTS